MPQGTTTMASTDQLKLFASATGNNDPDLRAGVHLRWVSNPGLGLPTRPFQLGRAVLSANDIQPDTAQDILWRDATERVVDIRNGIVEAEIFGYLPGRVRFKAFWFEDKQENPDVTGEVSTPAGFATAIRFQPEVWNDCTGVERIRWKRPSKAARYRLLALDSVAPSFTLLAEVGLPSSRQPRYQGGPNDEQAAWRRVAAGAPKRLRPMDSKFPPQLFFDSDDETKRVSALVRPELEQALKRLLADETQPQSELRHRFPLSDKAFVELPLIDLWFNSLLDPGVARWMGYADIDAAPPTVAAGDVLLYRLTGYFSADVWTALVLVDPRTASNATPGEHVRNVWALTGPWTSGGDLLLRQSRFGFELPPGDFYSLAIKRRPVAGGPGIFLNETAEVITYPVRPPGPGPIPIPPRPRPFPPAPPPVLRTKLTVRQAFAAEKPLGEGPHSRIVTDRDVPGEAQIYSLAVGDMFGRWTDWQDVKLPAGTPAPPPAPGLRAYYEMPSAEPDQDRPLSGKIEVEITLPKELPPGVRTIESVSIELRDSSNAVPLRDSRPIGWPPPTPPLKFSFSGPGLIRGERREMRVVARLLADGQSSPEATIVLQLTDPRPPKALILVPDVHWATMPDAMGQAHLQLSWPANAIHHQGYYVYESSQSALEQELDHIPAGQALTDAREACRDLAMPMTERATRLNGLAARFRKLAFERRTPTLIKPDGLGRCAFRAALPGRSRLLHVFRVVAVGHNNVEEPWESPPALFWSAVPSSIKPQAPRIEVESKDDHIQVRVALTVAPVPTEYARYEMRILRSKNPNASREQMLVVYEGPWREDGVVTDTDPPTNSNPPLTHWARYAYRAQVRARPPLDLTSAFGPWSDASAAAIVIHVPGNPPPEPQVTASVDNSGVTHLSWTCPGLRVRSTAMGDFRFRILRWKASGGLAQELAFRSALELAVPTDTSGQSYHYDPDPPPDQDSYKYKVELVDPLRRATQSREVSV